MPVGKGDRKGEVICTGSHSYSEAGFTLDSSPFGALQDFLSHTLEGEGTVQGLEFGVLALWRAVHGGAFRHSALPGELESVS